jgi:tRNA-2-methylthio-N6-dimethylallyladenosine synthase
MMKLIEDVGFDASFSFIFSPRPARLPPTWPTTHRTMSSSSACNTCRPPSKPTCAHQSSHGRHGAAHSGGRAFSRKNATELMGRTECNRIVNFPGGPHLRDWWDN